MPHEELQDAYFYAEHQRKTGVETIEDVKVLAVIAEGFDYAEYTEVVTHLKKEGTEIVTASFQQKLFQATGETTLQS